MEDFSPWLPFFLLLSLDQPGKSETYLEAIRKNIEWLKKHSKEEGKDGETKCLNSRYASEKHGYRHRFCVSARCPPCPWIRYTIFVLASVSSLLPILFSLLSFKRFVYLLNSSGLQGGLKKRARCTTEEGNMRGLFHQAQFAKIECGTSRIDTLLLVSWICMSSQVCPNYS